MRQLTLIAVLCFFMEYTLHAQLIITTILKTHAEQIVLLPPDFVYILTKEGSLQKWKIHRYLVDTIYAPVTIEDTSIVTDTIYIVKTEGEETMHIRTDTIITTKKIERVYFDSARLARQSKPLLVLPHSTLRKSTTLHKLGNDKIILYDKQSRTIIIYGLNLIELQKVELPLNLGKQISIVRGGPNNLLALYDNKNKQIVIYDIYNNNYKYSFYLNNGKLQVIDIAFNSKNVILCDTTKGVFIVNMKGKIIKTLNLKCHNVEISNDEIAIINRERIHLIDNETFEPQNFIPITTKQARSAHYEGKYIIITTDEEVTVYEPE